jgi:hypothetical protein
MNMGDSGLITSTCERVPNYSSLSPMLQIHKANETCPRCAKKLLNCKKIISLKNKILESENSFSSDDQKVKGERFKGEKVKWLSSINHHNR